MKDAFVWSCLFDASSVLSSMCSYCALMYRIDVCLSIFLKWAEFANKRVVQHSPLPHPSAKDGIFCNVVLRTFPFPFFAGICLFLGLPVLFFLFFLFLSRSLL